MKKSIYAQLVLIFIFIIFLGNFASSAIGTGTTESNLVNELSNSLTGVLGAARDAYEKGGVTTGDIEKLYAPGFIAVKFYSNINALTEEYDLSAENIRAVEDRAKARAGLA